MSLTYFRANLLDTPAKNIMRVYVASYAITHTHTELQVANRSLALAIPRCAQEEDWEGPEGTRLWGWAMQPVKESAPGEDFPELQAAGGGKRGVSGGSEAGRVFWVQFFIWNSVETKNSTYQNYNYIWVHRR